jgi:hypothetical protein
MMWRRLLAVLMVAGVSHFGWAQDSQSPIVRVEVDPPEVNVGQVLRLRVTVLAPTWFTKPPVYPNFELANALTRLPADSSFPTSQRIGADTWSGIVRDYEIYPQLAARYILADQTIRVTYMNPEGFKPKTLEVPVPEIAFQASVPAGAESLEPFLGATQVTLEREIDGDLASLKAGDAIVMKVTATIEGMPAMFLPALIPQTQQPGLALYPKEPAVADGQVARRVEEMTVLFEGGGEFTLPALELGWWNVRAKKIEVASSPAVVVAVAGPPVAVSEQAADDAAIETPDWRWLVAGLVVLALAVVAPYWVRKGRVWWRCRSEARIASEPYAFRVLLKSVAGQDVSEIDVCVRVWLERLDAGVTLERLSADTGVTELSTLTAKLTRARYSMGESAARENFVELGRLLRTARSAHIRMRDPGSIRQLLPPLNPTVAARRQAY